ncbi:MAG: DUF1064 domain-containing protein [Gallionella sp.]|nr:DUF1064 domain-containing protein [Gallionella sp.]
MSNAIRMTPEAAAAAQAKALDGWRRQGTVRTHHLSNEEEVIGFGHAQDGKSPQTAAFQAAQALKIGTLAGKASRSKYGAVKVYVPGGNERFDSKLEYRCWLELVQRQALGQIKGLRHHVKFSLFMTGGEHYGVWTADFVYEMEDPQGWRRVVADAKSAHTHKLPAWQKIKLLMKNCHGMDVVELP